MTVGGHHDDQKLIADVKAGVLPAIERFLSLAETTIWPTVVALVGEGLPADSAFLDVIKELRRDSFRRLSPYDGRSSVSTFLTLLTRDLLSEEVVRQFELNRNLAWRRFDRFFAKDIRKRICRRFPREDDDFRQDLFQRIALKLLEDDYRRIRLYNRTGSFCGYIMTMVDHMLIDIQREDSKRRRYPVEVARLPELHKTLFAAGAWKGVPLEPDHMMMALGNKLNPLPSRAELIAAIDLVSGHIATALANANPKEISLDASGEGNAMPEIASTAMNPEEALLEQEREKARKALLDQVQQMAESLPLVERVYLRVFMQSSNALPAREIAREMAVPVEQVYKLQQKMKHWMKNIAVDLQKKPNLSV